MTENTSDMHGKGESGPANAPVWEDDRDEPVRWDPDDPYGYTLENVTLDELEELLGEEIGPHRCRRDGDRVVLDVPWDLDEEHPDDRDEDGEQTDYDAEGFYRAWDDAWRAPGALRARLGDRVELRFNAGHGRLLLRTRAGEWSLDPGQVGSLALALSFAIEHIREAPDFLPELVGRLRPELSERARLEVDLPGARCRARVGDTLVLLDGGRAWVLDRSGGARDYDPSEPDLLDRLEEDLLGPRPPA